MNIKNKPIGLEYPTYFIAEIGSNFDGDKSRARDLIFLAKESGADAAKFQHYTADSLVSEVGFKSLRSVNTHQKNWDKSVFDTYQAASLRKEWTQFLSDTCAEADIDFLTSPYSMSLVDYVDEYVPAFKVGSGDITWHAIIEYMISKDKPVLIATGASDMQEVDALMKKLSLSHGQIVLMQCNTNYTGSADHFCYSHLNVLSEYSARYPEVVIGLSDHTPGYVTTLGAVALGARVIEKHFTDDNLRKGPDHAFALDPSTFLEMVQKTRDLEAALGTKVKKVEINEIDTRVVQRRAIRAATDLRKGHVCEQSDLEYLRPFPANSLSPYESDMVVGSILVCDVERGHEIKRSDFFDGKKNDN